MEIKPRPVKRDRTEEKPKQIKVTDDKKDVKGKDTNKKEVESKGTNKKEVESKGTNKKEVYSDRNLEKPSVEAFGRESLDYNINSKEVDLEQSSTLNSQKCIPQETVIYNVRLARAYVPFQKFCTTYVPLESLKRGTVFPELDL